jgi:hypothetical protein
VAVLAGAADVLEGSGDGGDILVFAAANNFGARSVNIFCAAVKSSGLLQISGSARVLPASGPVPLGNHCC